jgi:hypothetical protein
MRRAEERASVAGDNGVEQVFERVQHAADRVPVDARHQCGPGRTAISL